MLCLILISIYSFLVSDFLKQVQRDFNIPEELVVKMGSGVVLSPDLIIKAVNGVRFFVYAHVSL